MENNSTCPNCKNPCLHIVVSGIDVYGCETCSKYLPGWGWFMPDMNWKNAALEANDEK